MMRSEEEIRKEALQIGFYAAEFANVSDLVVVPEYRKYCEMNLCHCYDVVPACPPKCGSVDEMKAKIEHFSRVLVLQTECATDFKDDPAGAKEAKQAHNKLADQLIEKILQNEPEEMLRMSAGPWKQYSCMSAYCVDVQKIADLVGMTCWAQDGKCRFFSLILRI